MKKLPVLISNFIIVISMLLFVGLYVRQGYRKNVQNNMDNFTSMTIGMEQVTMNYLEGEQRLCDSWAASINMRNMTLEQTMSFLKVAQRIENISAHVIRLDGSFTGYANKPRKGTTDDFNVSYQDIDIFSSIDELLSTDVQVRVTRSYTNPMTDIKSIAFCNLLELRGENGTKERAILMRVIPVDLLADRWVFPTDKFSGAQITMIDSHGNYIIKGKSFKNSTFIEFYNSCNDTHFKNEKDLLNSIHKLGSFKIQNPDGVDSLIVHVPVNSTYNWTLLSYIPMAEIEHNQIDWLLISVIAVGLIMLLFIDLAVFTVFNKQLVDAATKADAANQAKTDFLSTMSHDIRTPMNAIIGLTTIAEKNVHDPNSVSDNLKKIRLASNHLLTLINDILDISKVESGRLNLSPVAFSIVDSAENLVNISQPMVRQKNIDFRFRSKNIKHEYLYADQLRINQIFINILSNALKYTPDSKSIYVDMTEYASEKEGCIKLEYRVQDTGMGMTKEFMQKMYQPFARETDSRINTIQGTGLGLAITRKMVDLMGGTIECESEPGKGTAFTVTLDIPISDIKIEEMSLPQVEVLVVDDDEILLETALETLGALGANADIAESGEAAISKILAHKEKNKSYNVIILDWKMPGLSGVELTKKIRETAGKDIPILLVSAYDWTQIEDSAREAGVNGFISKPLFRSSLYKKITEVLGLEKNTDTSEENNADLEGMSILVAEDMDVNWEVVSTLLDMYGIKTERAINGKEAIEKVRDMEPGKYEIIFMDIQMPVMNGLEATREIRKLPNPYAAGIPIIAMTADAFSENIAECLDAGMNSHISKPIDIKHVLKEIRRIRENRTTDEIV